MDFLEERCFDIICNAGDAKSLSVEAIEAAEVGNFKKTNDLLVSAEVAISKASQAHMEIICKEASGASISITTLLMHAEDQFLTTQTIMVLARKIINIYQNFTKK